MASVPPPKRILISAGEASGDIHAAKLVKAMRQLCPTIEFFGIGGNQMRRAGVDIIVDANELGVIGVVELLRKARHIYQALQTIRQQMRTQQPQLLILIDCPGINLRLARTAKKLGIKVLYYIPPQLWAWRRQARMQTIRSCVDKALVVLPFEQAFYQQAFVSTEYVGHPLTDEVKCSPSKTNTENHSQPSTQSLTVALLPGSRRSEIERLLPTMLTAAKQLKRRYPKMQFILPLASSLTEAEIQVFLASSPLKITVVTDGKHDALAACDAAIVTSGTTTLEVTLLGIPMVVVYKLSPITYWLARLLVKGPYISLCNIIAAKPIVKELIQQQATASNIADEIQNILQNPNYRKQMMTALQQIKESLGEGKVSERAAKAALALL